MENNKKQSVPITVLFACVHNAGRSYAAHSIANKLKPPNVEIMSAGSEPANEVNYLVTEALIALGYEPVMKTPRKLEVQDVQRADYVITMGCGEACPVFPGKNYLNWDIEDPAGKSSQKVLEIVKGIEIEVKNLLRYISNFD